MTDRQTFVIVGGGLAGAKAAETLRDEGFDGAVVLVAEEAQLPYERPPLSKSYLAGASTAEDARVVPEAFYAPRGGELRIATRATALNTAAHPLPLPEGEQLASDRLRIATGAHPRRPPIPGADGD